MRKLGKFPAETITAERRVEYGSYSLEIHRDAIAPGQRPATGGRGGGTTELVERLSPRSEVVGLAFSTS